MKKALLIIVSIFLVLSLVACNGSNENNTAEPTESSIEAEKTTKPLSATDWSNMLSETNFENFTLNMSGVMTVTQEGMADPIPNDVSQELKFIKDKMQITTLNNTGTSEEKEIKVIEGEEAAAQKEQISQIFMVILEKYENYVFDQETKTYKIPETVTFDITLKGLVFEEVNNSVSTIDVPATIVIREAEVTISDDGKLLTLLCDYSQTMHSMATTTSGKTTWEFSDYGTTVIE